MRTFLRKTFGVVFGLAGIGLLSYVFTGPDFIPAYLLCGYGFVLVGIEVMFGETQCSDPISTRR